MLARLTPRRILIILFLDSRRRPSSNVGLLERASDLEGGGAEIKDTMIGSLLEEVKLWPSLSIQI